MHDRVNEGDVLSITRVQPATQVVDFPLGTAVRLDGFWAPGDLTGTTASPLDPLLGPLSVTHGPTPTHAISVTSPALDSGLAAPTVLFDLLGAPRPQDGDGAGGEAWDVGAVERPGS